MKSSETQVKALLPVDEARALVVKAAEQGVATPELLGYHILRSAFGALHPQVIAFEQRPKLGQVGPSNAGETRETESPGSNSPRDVMSVTPNQVDLIARGLEIVGRALVDLRYAQRTTTAGEDVLVVAARLAGLFDGAGNPVQPKTIVRGGSAPSVLIHFDDYAMGLFAGEAHACAGIDVQAVARAPGGEGIGVDVRLNHNFSRSDLLLADLLRLVLPHQKGCRKLVAIGEKPFEALVVRFLVPSDTNR